jgi:pimeloyl-ACP methyl ester carboxylesterase
MNVVVNGLMTNYQKTGKGKVVVLLHGWGDSSKTFSDITEQLRRDYTLLAIDLPGFGGTQTPPSDWGTKEYAEFVAAWLKKIGEPKPFAVVAHSFGGAVSIKALGQGVITADKLILIAASGIRDINRGGKNAVKYMAKAGKPALYFLPANTRKKVRRKFYESVGSDRLLLPHMDEIYKRIVTEDVRNDAEAIKPPTLLIYADQDEGSPPAFGKILNSAIKGSDLVVIPSAGHFVHQEKPAEVAALIKGFLDA